MDTFFHGLFQTNRKITKELNDTLAQYGLFNSQWSVIYCLKNKGPLTLTEIWKYLNVEAPTVTRTVNRLEQLGWVESKKGADKREKIIHLTEKATDQYETIEESIRIFEEKVNGRLTMEEKQLFDELLNKIRIER